MRSINLQMKQRVIRLFLLGLSYDEMVVETGVSKGSVVNIIEDFRNGKIKLPIDLSEYVDLLRKTAVDLKNNQLSLSKLDVYIRIHNKMKQMGVSDTEVEEWLDIAHSISEVGVSNNRFVSCALELARLESREKVNYEELIGRYKAKSKDLESVNKELENGGVELGRLKEETSKSEEVLRNVRSETEALRRKRHEEEKKLSRYLKHNGLSWEMVKRTEAVINNSLRVTGLTAEVLDKVKKEIEAVGSLKAYIISLEEKKNRLEKQIRDLSGHVSACQDQLGESNLALQIVNRSLSSKQSELDCIEKETASRIENLYISRLILDFLFAPDGLSAADFDNLVRMLSGLRQQRLGIEPRVVTDTSGKVICRCQVPQITTTFEQYKFDVNHAREAFAYYLARLVKDKLVSRTEYDLVIKDHDIKERFVRLEGVIDGVGKVMEIRNKGNLV
jgi:hypothetical protein